MSLVDLILNLVGLLLWFSWRGVTVPAPATGMTLASTLRPAGPPPRRWIYLASLLALLAVRGVLYWQLGPPVDWVPKLPLGPTTLSFSSNFPERIFLFSGLSFAVTLGIFYIWLLLLSWPAARAGDSDAGQRLIRAHLGAVGRWPNGIKILLPLIIVAGAWCALHPLLSRLGMAPPASSPLRLAGQGAVIGLAVYLTLKFLLLALFSLHLVTSYVYLGEFSVWKVVNTTTRELLRPAQWLPLRAGKIDFAPVAAIVVVFVGAEFCQRGLTHLYEKLL
ncbi:MAG TPA: hypothetical protein VHB20_04960 [Verrucomicrobiae bacterium]|jgi:uncharacterized protein YggT (Ycf19 family)|nr:hypothetical protein [Verrucomicrobiae bacterium]